MVAQGPGLRAILLAGLIREGLKEEISLSFTLEMRRDQRAERRKEGTWVGEFNIDSHSQGSLELTKYVHMCNLISSSLGCGIPEVLSHLRGNIAW